MSWPAGQAETLLQHARVEFARGEYETCRLHVEDGLALVRDSDLPVETALLVQAARLTLWADEPTTARPLVLTALAAAKRSKSFVADAELVAAEALYVALDDGCVRHFAAAAVAARAIGDEHLELEARLGHTAALQMFRRPEEALREACAIEAEATARRRKLWAQRAAWTRARITWLATGDVTAALAMSGLASGGALGLHRPQMLAELALMLADAGESDAAHETVARARRAADTRWTISMTAFYEAEIEWAAGRVARAAQQAAATVAGEPPRPQELVARNTRLWALFELGHPEHDPHLDRLPAMPLLAGAVAENEAFAALADGELEHAEALLGDAAGLWRGQVTRAELRASWGKAEVAYRRGDRSGATEVLRTVEARASRLGLVSVLARARRSLDRMRTTMRRTPREARVSPREQEVLRLVGAGLRTPEIATRLGLSRRTVDAHVRAAMGKLGAATRVEAAALARGARAGETPPILFDAESELLRLLADGGTVAGAAAALGISRRTATRRLEAVRRRIGVRTNAEAALLVRPVR